MNEERGTNRSRRARDRRERTKCGVRSPDASASASTRRVNERGNTSDMGAPESQRGSETFSELKAK